MRLPAYASSSSVVTRGDDSLMTKWRYAQAWKFRLSCSRALEGAVRRVWHRVTSQ